MGLDWPRQGCSLYMFGSAPYYGLPLVASGLGRAFGVMLMLPATLFSVLVPRAVDAENTRDMWRIRTEGYDTFTLAVPSKLPAKKSATIRQTVQFLAAQSLRSPMT